MDLMISTVLILDINNAVVDINKAHIVDINICITDINNTQVQGGVGQGGLG